MFDTEFDIDFFVVGSQRCGTTWIDKALRSTDKVLLPKNKQTYFFDRNYKSGIAWYQQQFEEADKDKFELIGEVATGYCLDGAIDLLAKHYPKAKIILAVREPVSRAHSNYLKRNDSYLGMSFEDALLSDNDLVERGLYGDMLERVFRYYSIDNVKIVFFEDLEKDPKKYLDGIMKFIKLESEVDERLFTQNVNSSLLESVSNKARKLRVYFLIKFLKKIGLTPYIRRLIYWLHKGKRKPTFLQSSKLCSLFDSSNRTLEKICQRDLSGWRR